MTTTTTMPTTFSARHDQQSHRRTARAVGVLYLAGMAVGITGHVMITSIVTSPEGLTAIAANGMLLAVGAILWLLTVAGDAAHGILMFPVLRPHSERLAVGYLTARIADAVMIAVMVLLILVQVPVGIEYLQADPAETSYLAALSAVVHAASLYAYEIAMVTVGVAGFLLCSGLYRARLVPRPLAVWGLVGYSVLLVGSLLQVLGFNLSSVQAVPGGLWEVFTGVWLITKGFSRR